VLPNTTATITEAAAAAQQQQQLLWHQALQMATVGVGAPLAPPCVGATQFLATAAPVSFPANFSQLASLYHLPPTAVLSSAAAAPPAQAAAPTGSSAKKRKAVETSQEEVSRKQHKRASVVSLASSTVPSSVAAASCSTFGDDPPPRPKSGAELEKMTAAERRRYERNLREQQRSHRISQQIKKLRDVLTESNIPFRPNKYSILLSVADYIKQLQSRAIMLDAEHQRLIDTIRETTERVKTGQAVPEEVASFDQQGVDDDLLLVQGLDYKAVFEHCPYPLGVASLDGRILACNPEFEQVLACRHGELAEQSLFVFIRNHQEIFEAMASLLKRSSMEQETGLMQQQLLYWCGHITSSRNEKLPFTITLTSTADDNPKYFSFSAAAAHPN
jgi:PAS domain-containing protein